MNKNAKLTQDEQAIYDGILKSLNETPANACEYAKKGCGMCRGKGYYPFDMLFPHNIRIKDAETGKILRATPRENKICDCVEKRVAKQIKRTNYEDSACSK